MVIIGHRPGKVIISHDTACQSGTGDSGGHTWETNQFINNSRFKRQQVDFGIADHFVTEINIGMVISFDELSLNTKFLLILSIAGCLSHVSGET